MPMLAREEQAHLSPRATTDLDHDLISRQAIGGTPRTRDPMVFLRVIDVRIHPPLDILGLITEHIRSGKK